MAIKARFDDEHEHWDFEALSIGEGFEDAVVDEEEFGFDSAAFCWNFVPSPQDDGASRWPLDAGSLNGWRELGSSITASRIFIRYFSGPTLEPIPAFLIQEFASALAHARKSYPRWTAAVMPSLQVLMAKLSCQMVVGPGDPDAAVLALVQELGPGASGFMPALAAKTLSVRPGVAWRALRALRSIDCFHPEVKAILLEEADGSEPAMRSQAVRGIGVVGPEIGAEGLTCIAHALESRSREHQSAGIWAAAMWGPDAISVIPMLRVIARSGVKELSVVASKAIQVIGGSRALEAPKLPGLYAWQTEALRAWRGHGSRGVIEAVTGTGKTLLGLVAAAEMVERGGKVLVLVPTVELQEQWSRKLRQYFDFSVGELGGGNRDNLDHCNVLVAVINSARVRWMLPYGVEGLLIADECHRYAAAVNKAALEERFSERLGLSATFERSDDGHLRWLEPYFGGVCYRIGYQRAIADKVVSRFRLALIGTEFTEEERWEYDQCNAEVGRTRNLLIRRFEVTPQPFGVFMDEVGRMASTPGSAGCVVARSFLAAFNARREVLAQASGKGTALLKLLPALRRSRSVLFTQAIVTAEQVAGIVASGGIPVSATHSGLTAIERADILRRFAVGTLSAVVAPQVLDEGVDFPEADLGVIIAASRTRRQMIQRMGRVLRRKPCDSVARFVVMYVNGTSEDPANGAHEAFLSEITSVAEDVAVFGVSAGEKSITDYLADGTLSTETKAFLRVTHEEAATSRGT